MTMHAVDASITTARTPSVLCYDTTHVAELAHQVSTRDVPCRSRDPELWFAESPAGVDQAKQLCQECPLRQACLDGALDRREPWGVWGGELFLKGKTVAKKRGRGRPRKNPQPAAA